MEIRRYTMRISYLGTNYAGWQVQPNAVTVQQRIEEALETVFRKKISIHGSGRTDAGVHARGQIAHFDTEDLPSPEHTIRSLNGVLPNDIVIRNIQPVEAGFSSRFDANYRTYHYYFSSVHQPLHQKNTAVWWYPLDFNSMIQAASLLEGDIDCRSFTPFDESLPHHRCYFFESSIAGPDADERYYFAITANRFLRSVVRSIMGTLIQVGRGRITVQQFEELLLSPNRSAAGPTAPAKGLVLHNVGYDNKWRLPE